MVISRDVVFKESKYYVPSQVKNGKENQTNSFQFEVENESSKDHIEDSNGERSQPYSNPEVIESELEDNIPQAIEFESRVEDNSDLCDYLLSKDRIRREIKPPERYAHADCIAYALNIGDSIELEEPVSYQDVCVSNDRIH